MRLSVLHSDVSGLHVVLYTGVASTWSLTVVLDMHLAVLGEFMFSPGNTGSGYELTTAATLTV